MYGIICSLINTNRLLIIILDSWDLGSSKDSIGFLLHFFKRRNLKFTFFIDRLKTPSKMHYPSFERFSYPRKQVGTTIFMGMAHFSSLSSVDNVEFFVFPSFKGIYNGIKRALIHVAIASSWDPICKTHLLHSHDGLRDGLDNSDGHWISSNPSLMVSLERLSFHLDDHGSLPTHASLVAETCVAYISECLSI